MTRIRFLVISVLLLIGCERQKSLPTTDSTTVADKPITLADARRDFRTKLVRQDQAGEPLPQPPAHLFQLVHYESKAGRLAAFISPDPKDGKRRPAIIWITGGDCNTLDDGFWKANSPSNDQTASGFREAGVLMMFPTLRGGNQNPGFKEGFFGEVDDVLAAADYLAKQSYVDPQRIYLGGLSTGGTLVLLVAECTDRFRAIFSFGANDDASTYGKNFIPYDPSDEREIKLRSPIRWLQAIRVPTFVFAGARRDNISELKAMKRASTNQRVSFFLVEGAEHVTILAPTARLIARKILLDVGTASQISFTEDELNRLFAE